MTGRTDIMPPQPSARPTLGEYVIGVAGLALMRLAFTDDAAGRAARTAEIRDLLGQLDHETRLQAPVGTEYDLGTGYQQWSATYDQPLRLFPIEEPPMKALIETLPPGTVLDAACGTGRYSTMLASQGHDVIGVDQSAAMLDTARTKLPSADFREGDLTALPLPGRSVDAVVCALALVHVPQVASALNEFARVLRPGGRLIISDVHPFLVMLGWQAQFPAQGGEDGQAPGRGFMRLHGHLPSEYTGAATAAGLRLRSLVEPPLTESAVVTPAAAVIPDASRAAFTGLPAVSVWDFEHAGLPAETRAQVPRRGRSAITNGSPASASSARNPSWSP
jgi:SAM-dependent methyltransferase